VIAVSYSYVTYIALFVHSIIFMSFICLFRVSLRMVLGSLEINHEIAGIPLPYTKIIIKWNYDVIAISPHSRAHTMCCSISVQKPRSGVAFKKANIKVTNFIMISSYWMNTWFWCWEQTCICGPHGLI